MCGIFGFVSYNGRGPSLKRLERIARVTERRGPHAFGFAWIDGRGRLRMYKAVGRISNHLGVLAMAADARMFIGHTRWATHGNPSSNINNHPHPADGGWYVHNGVIANHDAIIRRNEFCPVTPVDTEVLGLMIDTGKGSILDRCVSAVSETAGSIAFAGLWSRPNRLVLARRGNPLSVGYCEHKRYYFASLAEGLPGDVSEVEDGSAMEFGPRKLQRACVALPTVAAEDDGPGWESFSEPVARPVGRPVATREGSSLDSMLRGQQMSLSFGGR
jgi:glucosamine--fructose-6-phosphate aminotransferase (isomerizing)